MFCHQVNGTISMTTISKCIEYLFPPTNSSVHLTLINTKELEYNVKKRKS